MWFHNYDKEKPSIYHYVIFMASNESNVGYDFNLPFVVVGWDPLMPRILACSTFSSNRAWASSEVGQSLGQFPKFSWLVICSKVSGSLLVEHQDVVSPILYNKVVQPWNNWFLYINGNWQGFDWFELFSMTVHFAKLKSNTSDDSSPYEPAEICK